MGTLIIDGNSLGHASHNATKLTVGEMQTQAIFGIVKSTKLLAEKYPGWKMLTLWDGKAGWRKVLHPAYKENRTAKDEKQLAHKEAYKAQSPFMRKALSLLGVRQMLATTHEADDMAGILVKKIAGTDDIVLVTGDQDWLQLVRPGVTWFDPIRDNTVGMGNFVDFTGYFTPLEFLQGKALMGDSSDNIPGVGGIGEKGAPEFLAQFKSIREFYRQVDDGSFKPKKVAHKNMLGSSPFTKEEWSQQFDGNRDDKEALAKHMEQWPGQGRIIVSRNLKLMNLLNVPIPRPEDVQNIPADYDEARFRVLCEKLAFMSILRDFDNFMRPFREHSSLAKAA